MNLDDFIEQTFKSIIEGVERSQKHAAKHGAIINAAMVGPSGEDRDFSDIRHIDFDIAVTVIEDQESTGGGQLRIAGLLNAGGGKSVRSEASTVSRIRFTLPLQPPAQKRSEARR